MQGLLFISLTLRLPLLRDLFGLSELALSGLMLLLVLLAGLGSVVAERMAASSDSATTLRAALALIAAGFVVLGAATRSDGLLPVLVAGVAIYGLGLGANDAASNMQAVALEHRLRRPVLPSFHAAWTAGGLLATGLAFVPMPLSVLAWLLALAPALTTLAPFLRRDIPAAPPVRHDADEASLARLGLPWRRILLVGVALVLFYMVDTAATAWGPTYLSSDTVFDDPPTSSAMVALATLPYLAATLLARVLGDGLTARFGPTAVVRSGALVAFAGLLVVVLAPASTWQVAILGFFVVGLGVAVIAPLAFSAAARIAGDASDPGDDSVMRQARVDATIARFNQFNYVGALLGAVLTGAVGSGNLRIGYAVPLVLVLALVPLARHFAGPDRRRAEGGRKSLARGATAP